MSHSLSRRLVPAPCRALLQRRSTGTLPPLSAPVQSGPRPPSATAARWAGEETAARSSGWAADWPLPSRCAQSRIASERHYLTTCFIRCDVNMPCELLTKPGLEDHARGRGAPAWLFLNLNHAGAARAAVHGPEPALPAAQPVPSSEAAATAERRQHCTGRQRREVARCLAHLTNSR